MKKEHIPYYISILSLIVSGIAIGVSCYRTKELSMDYMGVIVGILSLLVTALLTWNIYTVIDVKSIREDYEELKSKMDTEKKRLRDYVNIIQNFTMANVRLTENKYGDALGIYCNAAIDLYDIIKDNENKWNEENDEIDIMRKCIENAYDIINTNKDLKNSPLLNDMHHHTIQGLKDMNYNKMNDVKMREKINKRTKDIISYIEAAYNQGN